MRHACALRMKGHPMRKLLLMSGAIFTAVIATGPAKSDDVPVLNIEPVCRGIAQQAANPSERGGPDVAFSQCMQSEQSMRQRLISEWPTFRASDKQNCVGDQMGGQASYTDLVTCLEMARDARQLNTPAPPANR